MSSPHGRPVLPTDERPSPSKSISHHDFHVQLENMEKSLRKLCLDTGKEKANKKIDKKSDKKNDKKADKKGEKKTSKSKSKFKGTKSRLPVSEKRYNSSRDLVPSDVHSLHSSHLESCPNVRPNKTGSPDSDMLIPPYTLESVATKKLTSSAKKFKFKEYIPLCEMQKLLAKGEVVEGILRINQKNVSDAYISAPEGEIDICIQGLKNRNRAMADDAVVAKLLPSEGWKVFWDVVDRNWDEWKETILNKLTELNLNQSDSDKLAEGFKNVPQNALSLKATDFCSFPFYKSCVRRFGEVIYLVKRKNSDFVGHISCSNKSWTFKPFNKCIPTFNLSSKTLPSKILKNPKSSENNIYLVRLRHWPTKSVNPTGTLISNLGNVEDIEAQTHALLAEHKVDDSPFPKDITKHLPKDFDKIESILSKKELKSRHDLRDTCIFTIDPETARDLDDALSIETIGKTKDGNLKLYRVGIHISDVSHWLAENDSIDEIAKKRTTSFYCVQKVIPMLPSHLCEILCSLNPGEDKLTFSAFIEIDQSGHVHKRTFEKTIIKSCIKLSYDLAHRFIHEHNDWDATDDLPEIHGNYTYTFIADQVKLLNELAIILRQKRFDYGGIEFGRNTIRFLMDDINENPLGITEGGNKCGYLVEEFMLLANISAAMKINELKDGAVLRKHDEPDPRRLKEFQYTCQQIDFDFSITSAKDMNTSLKELHKKFAPEIAQAIAFKLLTTMKEADYFYADKNTLTTSHFGLGVPLYTHFTSPIRRYADVLVHRQLAFALGLAKKPKMTCTQMRTILDLCNEKKRASRHVGEGSIRLFLNLYIKSAGSLNFEGTVIDVSKQSFTCFLMNIGIQTQVKCQDLKLSSFVFEQKRLRLTFKDENKKEKTISLYQKITLKVSISDSKTNQWDIDLV